MGKRLAFFSRKPLPSQFGCLPQAAPADLEPTRLSRRLRGETALDQEAAEAEARAEVEAEGSARARRGLTRKRLALEEGQQLAAPFSLWSIGAPRRAACAAAVWLALHGASWSSAGYEWRCCGITFGILPSRSRALPPSPTIPTPIALRAGVTVWELGSVHRGAWAHRYWSSPGCLYHHAYPVGYRATKVQFGCTYEMRIEEGPAGPLFKVGRRAARPACGCQARRLLLAVLLACRCRPACRCLPPFPAPPTHPTITLSDAHI